MPGVDADERTVGDRAAHFAGQVLGVDRPLRGAKRVPDRTGREVPDALVGREVLDQPRRSGSEVVEGRVGRELGVGELLESRVELPQPFGLDQRVVRHEIVEGRRASDPSDPRPEPTLEQPVEAQGGSQLEQTGRERRIVRVDESEVDLPLVPQAGPAQGLGILLDEDDRMPTTGEFEGGAAPGQSRAEDGGRVRPEFHAIGPRELR
jgi:hypothetical protein